MGKRRVRSITNGINEESAVAPMGKRRVRSITNGETKSPRHHQRGNEESSAAAPTAHHRRRVGVISRSEEGRLVMHDVIVTAPTRARRWRREKSSMARARRAEPPDVAVGREAALATCGVSDDVSHKDLVS